MDRVQGGPEVWNSGACHASAHAALMGMVQLTWRAHVAMSLRRGGGARDQEVASVSHHGDDRRGYQKRGMWGTWCARLRRRGAKRWRTGKRKDVALGGEEGDLPSDHYPLAFDIRP